MTLNLKIPQHLKEEMEAKLKNKTKLCDMTPAERELQDSLLNRADVILREKEAVDIKLQELDLDRKKFWVSLRQAHGLQRGDYQLHNGEIWSDEAHFCDETAISTSTEN